MRGFAASRFSFNTGDGRCPECEGQGQKTIEMSFLPDVKVACEACNGARFNRETLGGDVAREIDRRCARDERRRGGGVLRRASRPASCAQAAAGRGPWLPHARAAESHALGRRGAADQARDGARQGTTRGAAGTCRADTPRRGRTLYVLDEPTVGLHMADVEKLIRVLHRLVDAGNTVVVIEHNLDVIADADWIIDLGPGRRRGRRTRRRAGDGGSGDVRARRVAYRGVAGGVSRRTAFASGRRTSGPVAMLKRPSAGTHRSLEFGSAIHGITTRRPASRHRR